MKDLRVSLLFVLLLLLFGLGIYRLFDLRFSAGDIFPPYSSLRADPVGSKGLYLAVGSIEGMEVARNYKPLSRLAKGKKGTIFILGLEGKDTAGGADDLKKLAEEGNRLVLAFRPLEEGAGSEKQEKKQVKVEVEDKVEEKKPPPQPRWLPEFEIASEAAEGGAAQRLAEISGLPQAIPIHTSLSFVASPDWRIIYSFQGRPVVVERRVGKGEVVLVADSYLFSNEAMREEEERQSPLISWLIGSQRLVIFDEHHFGLMEDPGIMGLVKKYGLLPFMGGLLLVAVLYIWHRAVPLAPAPAAAGIGSAREQKDHFSGLVNLLRRNISQEKIIDSCFQEWRRSFKKTPAVPQLEQMAAQGADRNPVKVYGDIAHLISEGNRHGVDEGA